MKVRTPKLRLREILRNQGRKQSWLAKQLGVSYSALQSWCDKKSCPNQEKISKMAEILEVDQSELYETKITKLSNKLERLKRRLKFFGKSEEKGEGWSKFMPEIFKP